MLSTEMLALLNYLSAHEKTVDIYKYLIWQIDSDIWN